jgi:MoaA/NifB/PqqE/SkfB family radical SAM enzyme
VSTKREEGSPFAPASNSARRFDAGAHALVGLARARLTHRPFVLSHLATGRCNAGCATCLWRDEQRAELDTETVTWLYAQAAAESISQLVVWGGEPLLRADLPELLAAARARGLVVTLISNGWLLPARWPELRGLVDVLIVSVDDVGTAHDRLRGLPGLFSCLEAFTAGTLGDPLRPVLIVNTVLSRLNVGALRRVAPLAKRWGAGLYFCPMETGQMRSEGFDGSREDLALAPEQVRDAARLARRLKAAGYPLLSTDRYLDLLDTDPTVGGYTCRAPQAILTVEADGAVRDCLRREAPLANVAELRAQGRSLVDVYHLPRFHAMVEEARGCTACNNPDVVETSWLWDLRPCMLRNSLRLAAS